MNTLLDGALDVMRDRVGAVRVSTRRFMADRYTPGGAPAYWETAVIAGAYDYETFGDLWDRYPSRDAAVAGHARAVAAVRARLETQS